MTYILPDTRGIRSVKKVFWTKDWFTALVVVIAVLVLSRTDFMRSLELAEYDFGVRRS